MSDRNRQKPEPHSERPEDGQRPRFQRHYSREIPLTPELQRLVDMATD